MAKKPQTEAEVEVDPVQPFSVAAESKYLKDRSRYVIVQDAFVTPELIPMIMQTGLLAAIPRKQFDQKYVKFRSGGENEILKLVAQDILNGPYVGTAALHQIERILEMDTRNKSTAEIRKEILRLAEQLPEDHPQRRVPANYAERSQAIVALTAIRQTIFKLKGNTIMATAKTAAKKTTTTTATATKKAAAAPKPKKADAVYKLAGEALKAKEPADLRMHGESVRAVAMKAILAKAAKGTKEFPAADLDKLLGEAISVIPYFVRQGFLVAK